MSELTEEQKEECRRRAMEMLSELIKPKKKEPFRPFKLSETKSIAENLDDGLKFYLDAECTRPIEKVQWDKGFHVTMIGGKEEILPNTVETGGIATATFYVRNETPYKFGIKDFDFPDRRVKILITDSWLLPMIPTKIVLTVSTIESAAQGITESAVESAQLMIKGFFVIE